MPLETQIERSGKTLHVRWGYFHLNAMYTAAIKESVPNKKGLIAGDEEKTFGELADGELINFGDCYIYGLSIPGCPLVERGEQTLLQTHTFTDTYDGEVFTLKPGDILRAWRSYGR